MNPIFRQLLPCMCSLVHDATGDVDACYGAPQGTLEKKNSKAKFMRDLAK